MARPKAPDKDVDFLKRLFDEPAGGKSSKSRSSNRSGFSDERARLLAVLEAAAQGPHEAIVLDDALLAAYLDGALGSEEQLALEGLLARSADLREQLAAAGEARAAVLGGRAKMPKSYIEDFDSVSAPKAEKQAESRAATRGGALSRWLAGLAPGRRWAAAALPVVFAVVIVAVIGPGVYGPEKSTMPKPATVGEVAAEKEDTPRASAATAMPPRKKPAGSSMADKKRRLEKNTQILASAHIPLDSNLRLALVRMGLRQNRSLAAGAMGQSRIGAKKKAENAPVIKSSPPRAPRADAEARRKRMTVGSTDRSKRQGRMARKARESDLSKRPKPIQRSIELALGKECKDGAPTCCERRRIDPKLLKRLLSGEPPLRNMRVVQLSSKTCLLTLPVAEMVK